MNKIASAIVILADEDDFAGMNEEWVRLVPTNPPARQGAKVPVRVPGLKVPIAPRDRSRTERSRDPNAPKAW